MSDRKVIVVYYSASGTTRRAAEAIAAVLGADLEPIVAGRQPSGFTLLVRIGLSLVLGRWDVRPCERDLASYDLIVIGGPIWVGRFATPVRAWLKVHALATNTRLAVFCTMSGGTPEAAFAEVEALAGRPATARLPLTEANLAEPQFSAHVQRFAQALGFAVMRR